MPAITTLIALAGVAASVGGVIQAKSAAEAQAAAAAAQVKQAKAAMQAKRPSEDTASEIKLATADKELRRGKGGTVAERNKKKSLQAGGLPTQSASEVGGLGTA